MTKPTKTITQQDITHQGVRLARAIDRLPDGNYTIRIEKRSPSIPWRASIIDDGARIWRLELPRPQP